jgi:hypothetical protein
MKNTEEEKVISLFAPRDNAKKSSTTKKMSDNEDEEEIKADKAEGTFEDIASRNLANQERMKRERLNANKSVLRSYRIKN